MFLKFYQISKDHPEISYEISEPLGTHDYMVDLVENVFKMLKFLPLYYAIVLIAHGSFSYTKAHDELKEFSEK